MVYLCEYKVIITFIPSSQLIQRSPLVRKQPTACLAKWWIQPSCCSCIIMASIHGKPVFPWKQKSSKEATFSHSFLNHEYTSLMIQATMVDERKRGARKKRERVFTSYFIILDTFYLLLNWFSTCVSDNWKYEKWLSLYADWLQSINSIVTYSLSENWVCWLAPKYILFLLTYFRKTNSMAIMRQ